MRSFADGCQRHASQATVYGQDFGRGLGTLKLFRSPQIAQWRKLQTLSGSWCRLQTAIGDIGLKNCGAAQSFEFFHNADDILATDHDANSAPSRVFQRGNGG